MLSKLAVTASATACSILLWKRDYLYAAQPILKYELCQVQVIFRHGARTPIYDVPYLPVVTYEQCLMNHREKTHVNYKLVSLEDDKPSRSLLDESYINKGFLNGGCVRGQLTSVGAEQCFQLGRRLRNHYINERGFLSPGFLDMKRDLYVRSTHVVRTVASARSVLAGLFSEYGNESIEIHVASAQEEVMYPNYNTCARFKKMTRWAWENPEQLDGLEEIKRRVAEKLNLTDDAQLNLVAIKDNFLAARAHDKPFLCGIDSQTAKLLNDGAMKILISSFVGVPEFRDQTLKLAIGPFVDILLTNMEKFVRSSNSPDSAKFFLYSGHDTTLIPLMCALGIESESWPPFASNVVLELYRNTDIAENEEQYYVKVLFNDEEKNIAQQSSTFCPLSRFLQLLELVRLPNNEYLNLCKLNDEEI